MTTTAPNKNDCMDSKTIAVLVNEERFSYPYIPTGIYAEIWSLSNLRFQTQEKLTRIKNCLARWFAIHFLEYKDDYGDLKAVSGESCTATRGHQEARGRRSELDLEIREAERD